MCFACLLVFRFDPQPLLSICEQYPYIQTKTNDNRGQQTNDWAQLHNKNSLICKSHKLAIKYIGFFYDDDPVSITKKNDFYFSGLIL